MSRSLTRNRLGGPVRMPQKSQRGASGMPAAGGAGYHPSGTSVRTHHPSGTSVRARAIHSHPPRRAPSRKDSHGQRCTTSHNAAAKTGHGQQACIASSRSRPPSYPQTWFRRRWAVPPTHRLSYCVVLGNRDGTTTGKVQNAWAAPRE